MQSTMLRRMLAAGAIAWAGEAYAQVPVYMPQPQPNTATAPSIADPSPVYRPPVYRTASMQPSAGFAPTIDMPTTAPAAPWPTTETVPPPNYASPNYAPPGAVAPTYAPTANYGSPQQPSAGAFRAEAPYSNGPLPYSNGALPGYGGGSTPAFQSSGPAYAPGGEMPCATFDRQNFPPYGTPTCPPKYKQWVPTRYGNFGCGRNAPPCAPQGYGCEPNYACNDYGCDPMCYGDSYGWFDNISAFWAANAFKSPVDLDGLNANFGTRFGAFGAVPLSRQWGLGIQAGGSAGFYDWKGTPFTGDDGRQQYFATLGIFQRFCSTGLGYAVAYDWLWDDYYSNMFFGQWRVAGSWQFNPCNEIGVWASLPDRRDEAYVGNPAVRNDFASILQGNVYLRHVWSCAASTTVFAGLAESPSDITWGSSTQVAVNNYMALTGGFQYILPGSGGTDGRQEEVWALSFGFTFYPGTAMCTTQSQFRPFLPMADNGNFAIRRK